MKAVVLLSGGMDSTTALALTVHQGAEAIATVTASYGSLHQEKETEAARRVYAHFLKRHATIHSPIKLDLHSAFTRSKSALLGNDSMPDSKYSDLSVDGPSATVVPFRNAHLLSSATTIALDLEYDTIVFAAHANDAAHWAYPDCTPEFTGAMACAIYVGSMHKVRLTTPFQFSTKAEIVKLAAELGAPLQLTWSCYRGLEKPCGTCPTCLERIGAFKLAGYKDPVEYLYESPWPEHSRAWEVQNDPLH